MVLAELCLLFSALLFVILASLKFLSFDFAFVFGFVFLAVLSWYLFEHFHIINLPYTYEVYNLLSKIFYSLLALRIAFLTIIATYSIIAFAFVNFELFVAEACGGEVIKAGTKVASGAGKIHENFFKLCAQEGLNRTKTSCLDFITAGSTFDKLSAKYGSLKAIEGMANQQKIDKFIFNASREEMNLIDGYLSKLYAGKRLKYLPLSDEYNFMTRLKNTEQYFTVLNRAVCGESTNLYALLHSSLGNNIDFESVKVNKVGGLTFLNFLRATTIKSIDGGVLYLRDPSLLFGDPARLNGKKLSLQADGFDLIFFYENLKHRVYPETFKVAEPRPDASEAIKLGEGVGDFVAKFKGDNELTYCEGKTAHYFNSKVVGYLAEENYFVFEKDICNYVLAKLPEITNIAESDVEVSKKKDEHPQLIYHMSKGRQVAYVFNFCNIYTKDPELLLRIEEKLNEDLIKYIPSRGTIRLACLKLDDKIIQSENLD
jgi:hypothetical protein